MTRTLLPERNLDLLRCVAVLCVLGGHIILALGIPARGWLWMGRIGVLLFFVHTSLVLMGSLERQGESNWILSFYIRRAFRIYPLAVLTIIVVVLLKMPYTVPTLHGPVVPFEAPSLATLAANLGLFQNLAGAPVVLNVLWTLPVELQMYLVLPFCYLIARKGVAPIVAMFAASVVIGLASVTYENDVHGLWRLSTIEFVPCFLSGVLCYAILRRGVRAPVPAFVWPAAIALM